MTCILKLKRFSVEILPLDVFVSWDFLFVSPKVSPQKRCTHHGNTKVYKTIHFSMTFPGQVETQPVIIVNMYHTEVSK